MDIDPYTNRELDEWRNEVKISLEAIRVQTTKTNGSVADIKIWKEQMTGAAKAYGFCLVLVILPLAAWVLYNQVTEPERLNQAVKSVVTDYFAQYNVQIVKPQ